MFRQSQDLQMTLDDRMLNANKQTRKAVESSKAKTVGDIAYPYVDESRFAGLFSDAGSRPNIEIKRYVSALVLKRMYRMSDEMLIEFIRCGALNFQYALHTTQADTQPLSESSLRRFRRLVEAYNDEHKCDLIKEEFERISRMMAMNMGVLHDDPNKGEDDIALIIVRMDSMEIEAHAKAMTRIEILYTSIIIVLRYLHKKKFSDIIPDELAHYNEEGDHNRVMYYRVEEDKKAGVQDTRVAETINEML
ncbi:MAG: transposase, partial [Lachnospiraceae bacterium]|nr:transposase [Lachnospiraceae bacterium]